MINFFQFFSEFKPNIKEHFLMLRQAATGGDSEEKLAATVSGKVNLSQSFSYGKRFYITGLMIHFGNKTPQPIRFSINNKLYSDNDPDYGPYPTTPDMAHYPVATTTVIGFKGVFGVYDLEFPIPTNTPFKVECVGGGKIFYKGWLFRSLQ